GVQQRVEQEVRIVLDGTHGVGAEQLGEHARHEVAVLEHVGDAARAATVVFQHQELAAVVADQVRANDVRVDAARRPHIEQLALVLPAREQQRRRQHAIAKTLLLAVHVEQKCLRDRVLPPALLLSRREYKRELLDVRPPGGVYTHVVGTDLIRDDRGEFLVLEDNCRCPSGVSYVLENRNLMTRVFPELFGSYPVRPIKDYPNLLLDALLHAAPRTAESPVAVVLSPGIHNSAFFEHSFLAREMGTTLDRK